MPTGMNKPGMTMATGINTCACEPVRSACYADRHEKTRHDYGDRHNYGTWPTAHPVHWSGERSWEAVGLVERHQHVCMGAPGAP